MRHTSSTQAKTSAAFPLCCILAGAVFLLFPGGVLGLLSLILGLLCLSYGAWKLISAIRTEGFIRIGAIIGGAAALLFGGYILRRPEQVFSLLPVAVGLLFLLDGIDRIRCAAAMHRTVRAGSHGDTVLIGRQKRRFYTACIIGVLTLICGIVLLWRPFDALELALRVIGGMILLNGIGALWTNRALHITQMQFSFDAQRRAPDGKYEASFRDITDEDE